MSVITRGVRNAFRNNIRALSVILILGLSLGLGLIMVVARQAVQDKISSVKSSIGNIITVSPAGARGFEGGGEPLTSAQIDKVRALPHVASVAATLQDRLDSSTTNLQSAIEAGSLGRRFRGGASGSSGGDGLSGRSFTPPVIVTGTNDLSNTQALGGNVKITAGQAFDPAKDANVALLGAGLATKNNLATGQTFQAYGATITVAGIFDSGNRFADNAVVMPLATVQRLSQQPDDVSSAIVRVDSISNLDATVTSIKNTLGDAADVVSQQDTSSQALSPLENIKDISLMSLIGALVAGSVIMLLTMLMIVRERRREIGVLKAIGASNLSVVGQFMSEAIAFTLLGGFVGVLIGVLGAGPVTNLLVSSSANTAANGPRMAGGFGGGGGFGRAGGGLLRLAGQGAAGIRNVHAVIGWDILLYGLATALVIAIVGSAIPAWLIAKVRPAEVMRAE